MIEIKHPILEFESNIGLERSITSKVENLGKAKSMMLLKMFDNEEGSITWEYEFLDDKYDGDSVGIGLWFEGNELVDYDGVFELPEEAITLLEMNGFNADYAK